MSEKATQELRDEAATCAIDAVEYRRKAERLQALLEEKMAQLVQTMIERDEARRELAEVQTSERAVRRLVLTREFDGDRILSIADVRHALDTGEVP